MYEYGHLTNEAFSQLKKIFTKEVKDTGTGYKTFFPRINFREALKENNDIQVIKISKECEVLNTGSIFYSYKDYVCANDSVKPAIIIYPNAEPTRNAKQLPSLISIKTLSSIIKEKGERFFKI